MRTHPASRATRPVELLFGKYRRRILGHLLLHPDESFYVREIARLTGTPAGSLHRELKGLAEAGLVTRTESGNQVRYQADRTSVIFEDLAAIFRKTTGLADVLRDALAPLAPEIDLAFVFGSVARGEEHGGSDVDVLVVGDAPFASVVEVLNEAGERLRRHTNPVVMTAHAFRANVRGGDRFASRVVREPKLFLLGDADELGELVEDRPAERTPAGRGRDSAAARGRRTQPPRRRRR